MTDDFAALIPELPRWNNGAGIDPESWIERVGNYELATGYSLIFWPKFVQFDATFSGTGFPRNRFGTSKKRPAVTGWQWRSS